MYSSMSILELEFACGYCLLTRCQVAPGCSEPVALQSSINRPQDRIQKFVRKYCLSDHCSKERNFNTLLRSFLMDSLASTLAIISHHTSEFKAFVVPFSKKIVKKSIGTEFLSEALMPMD